MEFLVQYAVLVIVGICACIGFILKKLIPSKKLNKYIPLIMGVLGLGLNIWINNSISPDIILGGLFSGLASTGAYEAVRNIIESFNTPKKEG